MYRNIICALFLLMLVGAAGAQVEQYYDSQIVNQEGFCDFDDPGFYTQTDPYSEGGMTFWLFGEQAWGQYSGYGGDGYAYYSDGGGYQPAQIIRTDGGDFAALEFTFGDGWGQQFNYGYAVAYLDNVPVGSFDIDGEANVTIVGFKGEFDELRVAFYYDDATRDMHDLNYYSAGLVDNVLFGTVEEGGLEVFLEDYPSSVGLGETLSFTAGVENTGSTAEAFDQALLDITGPAQLTRNLYSGPAVTLDPGDSVSAPVRLNVPVFAPLGLYTVDVKIYLDGSFIDSESFDVEVVP